MQSLAARRRPIAALALLAVAITLSVGPALHESRAEADGACVACILALNTVGVHVAVFSVSTHLVPLGMVEDRECTMQGRFDRLSSDSRGPPLV